MGALFAAGVAFVIGKIALGLRSDYLAIATLGISEIIIFFIKNEEWLTRGVKNVNGLPRPVPYEIDLQQAQWFQEWALTVGMPVDDASAVFVKICYALLFIAVIGILLWLSETALKSPWGRMMRAMTMKPLQPQWKRCHMATLAGVRLGFCSDWSGWRHVNDTGWSIHARWIQPSTLYFLDLGDGDYCGSGNNWGAVLGGFFIGSGSRQSLSDSGYRRVDIWNGSSSAVRHICSRAPHMRLMTVGIILLTLAMHQRPYPGEKAAVIIQDDFRSRMIR